MFRSSDQISTYILLFVSNERDYIPWKTTIVTNCHIRALSSKMTWPFAILAKITLADKKCKED